MTNTTQTILAVALILSIAVLVGIGLRLAPVEKASTGAEALDECDVDAPDALRPPAEEWCANGLVARVAVTGDKNNVIAVIHFNPNGSHVWQLQRSSLIGSFRQLTDRMAERAEGRDVSISVHGDDDTRVAACARLKGAAAAACEEK